MLRLRREDMADGATDLPLASHVSQSTLPCDACAAGKSHRQPIAHKATHRATRCLELVHSDMWGPINVDADGGWTGFLTFIDDFSREAVVYLMKGKSGADVLTHLTDYKAWAENITGQRLTALRTDNGGEFINRATDQFLRQHGVTRQVTTAYTSSQNGVAERFNRTIMDTVRSMLHHANLADYFWPLAVQAATYVKNRCPTTALQHITPHQAWHGHRPDLHSLRVFGCVAHLHIPEQSSERVNKLSARSVPCINVGYSLRSKGYLLFNPCTRRIHTSKDVTFEETRFIDSNSPLARRHIGEGEMSVLFPDIAAASQQQLHIDEPPEQQQHSYDPPAVAAEDIVDELVEAGLADYSDHELEQSESEYESDEAYDALSDPVLPQAPAAAVDDTDDALDRMPLSEMARQCSNVLAPARAPPAPAQPAPRRSQRGGGLPSSRALDSSHHARVLHTEMECDTCDGDEPRSYTEAMSRPDATQWRAAIDSELDSLKRTGTWTLTPLPAGRQAIGSRWVLKIKRKADGTVDKYKARLVAKGYAQKAGIDYDETFAPVAKFTSIRMLLALAARYDLEIHQMDVRTAFLNGDLDVDIYMEQPEGYSTIARGEQRLVCKLQKALYGLKQAGRAWNEKMVDALLRLHFTPLDSDSCVFVHRGDGYVMFIALYVDDLLIFSSSLPRLLHLKSKLSQLFEMTDMGEAHYILGLKITRNRSVRQLCLSQQEYVRRVVERYGLTNCNPASIPLTTGTTLSKADCPITQPATPVTINGHTYASVVGALMYAMLGTRPDLAYSVGCLSRFNSNPGAAHVAALKHVLRYLAGTTDYCLVYGSNQVAPFDVFGYCDSDYAACVDDRRSVAGWVFMAAGGATSWQSQKQKSVALSTVEAEYMAACAACKEAVWQRAILAQAGVSTDQPMLILTDNQGAMALAKNPNHHQRSKHIDIRYHYVRQQVSKRTVQLDYIATADQAADQLTKPLSKVQHDRCLVAMGIRSASAPTGSLLKLHTLRS
jgi:transposase InsO family protein